MPRRPRKPRAAVVFAWETARPPLSGYLRRRYSDGSRACLPASHARRACPDDRGSPVPQLYSLGRWRAGARPFTPPGRRALSRRTSRMPSPPSGVPFRIALQTAALVNGNLWRTWSGSWSSSSRLARPSGIAMTSRTGRISDWLMASRFSWAGRDWAWKSTSRRSISTCMTSSGPASTRSAARASPAATGTSSAGRHTGALAPMIASAMESWPESRRRTVETG